MDNLYKKYYEWIDWSVYDGLSPEERTKLEEEHKEKYGLNHILRPDAPVEAVKAWAQDAKMTREADAEGKIIN